MKSPRELKLKERAMSFTRSAQLLERSRKVLAGGVSSDVRKVELPHPLFFASGKGSRIWDVDGNEFIDYVLAQGPLLMGHSPEPVLEAVTRQLRQGLMYGSQHEGELELAELLTHVIPCAERVRFNSTGSEAVITALRVARAYRNRTLVVKFEGQWHGWYDSLLVSTAPAPDQAGPVHQPRAVLPSCGQVANAADNLIILPWNDLNLVEEAFSRRGHQIAAVLTEPVMCNSGSILPQDGFLQGLRQLCTQYETALIFDEVITGFRLALGGAQEFFGVVPDLATLAKGIASGFSLSAVAGKAEFMDLISTGKVIHAGTYNSNPVVIAAGLATVRHLRDHQESIYSHLFRMSERLRAGLQVQLQKVGIPAQVNGIGPIVQVSLTGQESILNYRDWMRRDTASYERIVNELANQGIRTTTRGTWYLSTDHSEEDIDETLVRFEAALQLLACHARA
jgi:glutamate-1-semialdehyde 2,1-aminomutase